MKIIFALFLVMACLPLTVLAQTDNLIISDTDASHSGITTGDYNVFVGSRAAQDITTGSRNVMIGSQAGRDTTSGNDNVFLGAGSARVNNGSRNVMMGNLAGHFSTGSDNTWIGNTTGRYSSTASQNVCLGSSACAYIDTGERNIVIGGNGIGDIDVPDPDGDDQLLIAHAIYGDMGTTTATGTGDADITIDGYLTVTSLTTTSDRRKKDNIQDLDPMLEKLLALNPVSYKWNEKKPDPENRTHYGFIAQEVQQIIPDIVDKDDTNPEGYLRLRYKAMLPVLVSAIQAQQKEIEALEAEINEHLLLSGQK